MLSLCCCFGFSLVVASRGYSPVACTYFSLSLEHRLNTVAHGLGCCESCGIFRDQGSNPSLLHKQADFLPLSQGRPGSLLFLSLPVFIVLFGQLAFCPWPISVSAFPLFHYDSLTCFRPLLYLVSSSGYFCFGFSLTVCRDFDLSYHTRHEELHCAHVLSGFNRVWLFVIPWTVACQAPLSMRFSRQEYWSGLPCSPQGVLPDPGIKPPSLMSPALAGRFFTTSATWDALESYIRTV